MHARVAVRVVVRARFFFLWPISVQALCPSTLPIGLSDGDHPGNVVEVRLELAVPLVARLHIRTRTPVFMEAWVLGGELLVGQSRNTW